MADTEAGLPPGGRLLWTGRPARARVIPGDLICSAQLAERTRTWAAKQHTHLG